MKLVKRMKLHRHREQQLPDLFFTSDNKLIARFEPDGFVETQGSDYRDYSMLGKAPTALADHQSFKMVVLANWPQYGDDTMKAGETLLADICNAAWGRFDSFSAFELGRNG